MRIKLFDSPISNDLFAIKEVENVLVEMLWKMWGRCV